jgi:hypothetical protein
MKYHFFTIAAQTPESGQEALNVFCVQQRVLLVPNLQIGNREAEALASRNRKLELPQPNSQAGAWELAERFPWFVKIDIRHSCYLSFLLLILTASFRQSLPRSGIAGGLPEARSQGRQALITSLWSGYRQSMPV